MGSETNHSLILIPHALAVWWSSYSDTKLDPFEYDNYQKTRSKGTTCAV